MSTAFGPNGRTVAAGSEAGHVLVWDLFPNSGAAPTAAEVAGIWKDLGGDDAGRAHRDMARLLAAPKETVALSHRTASAGAPNAGGTAHQADRRPR